MADHILIIIVANLLLYFRTLRFKFVSDDLAVLQRMRKGELKRPPNWFVRMYKYFIGEVKIIGWSISLFPKGFLRKPFFVAQQTEEAEHLLTLLIHIAICVMIYLAFGPSEVSLIAALLYGANPANNQGTIWPGGRAYALSALCLLISLKFVFIAPIFLGFCAFFTAGFLAPLALIGHPNWWILAFLPLVWLLHSRKFYTAVKQKADTESFTEDRFSLHPKKFILATKTLGFYTTLCLVPFRITFYHNFLQSAAGSLKHRAYSLCRYFWIGVAFILGVFSTFLLSGWTPFTWALCAWIITIAPFCNFVRANQEIAERFAALPNMFLMYALAQVIVPYPLAFWILLTFYATRAYYTVFLYRDDYFITECAVIEDPYAWWAWHCRGMKRWDNKAYKEAVVLWVMAKMISPKEFKVLMNLASALRMMKNDKEADLFLAEAEKNIIPGQEKQAREFIENHKKGKLPILL